jgi:hypothetical protein
MFRTFIKSQVLFWMSISKLWGHPLDSSPSLSLSFLGYREWIKGGGGGRGRRRRRRHENFDWFKF